LWMSTGWSIYMLIFIFNVAIPLSFNPLSQVKITYVQTSMRKKLLGTKILND